MQVDPLVKYPLDATEAQLLRYDLVDTGVRLLSYVNADGFVSVKTGLKDTSNCVEFSLDNEVGVVIDIRPCR